MKKLIFGAAMAAAMVVGGSAGASARAACPESSTCQPEVEVSPVALASTPVVPAAPSVPQSVVAAKQQLPVTGGDATGIALVGAGLIGGGAFLVRRSTASAAQ
ncbi:MAG: LPXTG-motif cell wall-anchored protein [Acidimicrobiales bacterium]|jgi:LPXTG-motif cell wall-anchored protein